MRKCFPGHSDKRHSHFEVALSVLGEHCESEGGAGGRFGEGASVRARLGLLFPEPNQPQGQALKITLVDKSRPHTCNAY